MTNYAEEGLASLFSKHGCSTGSEDGWTVASRKKKKTKKNVNHTDDKTFNPPVLTVHTFKTGDEDLNNSGDLNKAHMGVSPFVASKNKFELLNEWESDIENQDEMVEKEEKHIENNTSTLSKKIKLKHKSSNQDNFDDILKEFADMDAEYVFFASEATKTIIYKKSKNGVTEEVVPKENFVRENRKKVFIDRTVSQNLDASEQIQLHSDLLRNYHDCSDPEILEASNDILKNPRSSEFDKDIQDLPKPYFMYYPVSTLILLSFCADQHKNDTGTAWRSHGTRKQQEIQLDECTFIIYELKRLGLFQQYKDHWSDMEDYYNDWNVPHKYRSIFRSHELNYLSLMIHDIKPSSYMKNLSPIDQEPKGKIFNYFNKYDNVETARFKWLSAIKNDYIWFWRILHDFSSDFYLSSQDSVKFQDLIDIIKFINPRAWHLALLDPIYSKRIAKMVEKARFCEHWIVSRHKFYYEWMFLGWAQIPNDFPFHKSPFCSDPNQITNWIHKRFSHKNYLNQDLYFRDDDKEFVSLHLERNFDKNQPNNKCFENDDPPGTTYTYTNEDGIRIQADNDPDQGYMQFGLFKSRHRWLKNEYFINHYNLYDEVKFNKDFGQDGKHNATNNV